MKRKKSMLAVFLQWIRIISLRRQRTKRLKEIKRKQEQFLIANASRITKLMKTADKIVPNLNDPMVKSKIKKIYQEK